jgi:GNAT superfamily N-acetyltransferase
MRLTVSGATARRATAGARHAGGTRGTLTPAAHRLLVVVYSRIVTVQVTSKRSIGRGRSWSVVAVFLRPTSPCKSREESALSSPSCSALGLVRSQPRPLFRTLRKIGLTSGAIPYASADMPEIDPTTFVLGALGSSVDMPDSRFDVRLIRPDEHVELRTARLTALAYSPLLANHLAKEAQEGEAFWIARAERGGLGETMATFVATEPSGFVGIVDGFLSDDGRMVEIGGMWVSPHVRRSGVGRELLAAVCAWGRTRGAQQAGLWVRSTNEPARNLYEREGFEFMRSSDTSGTPGLRLERDL